MFEFSMSLFTFALIVAAVYGLVNWAMRANAGDKAAIMGLYLLWGMPGVLLAVAGLALVVNGREGGWIVMLMGVGFSLPLLAPFRKAVAALTPMDEDSAVDYSGLAVILGLLAFLGTSVALSTEAEPLPEMSTGSLMGALITNCLAFVGVAYAAVGYRNYRTGPQATERLGLRMPTVEDVGIGLLGALGAFVCGMIGSALTVIFQPDVVESLTEGMDSLTSGVTNPLAAVVLGLATGIGEEVLFRGAIQPRFGIVLTTALWMLMHVQYGFSLVLVGLGLTGILFGLIRNRYGTVPAIIAHAVYNMVVVALQTSIFG